MKENKADSRISRRQDKPNFLVLLVDEERYPPVYESPDMREWRRQNLTAQELLRAGGLEFHRHYIGSAACCPSRATLLTGQYPSLHGVSQTDGVAKSAFDSDMFWLDRSTVPTMGDYFREAGYETYYKGKWHVSYEDIVIPGTHTGLPSYNPANGMPDVEREALYKDARRLDDYGFAGWIGPEPHGRNPRNSASSAATGVSGRDEIYGAEAAWLIEALDRRKSREGDAAPWLLVASFVNPHDIVLYGALTSHNPLFRFQVEPMPEVSPPPTINERLDTKPRCQASYRDVYPKALQPIPNQSYYRKLYYQLQKNADRQMGIVLDALLRSSFYDNTIIIFTSDHGDLLGSHGRLYQKFYCAYEEVVHVPFLIHQKRLIPRHANVHTLTSHVDLLPTMLGLANADVGGIQSRLRTRFSDVRPFPGRDLSSLVRDPVASVIPEEPVYFMTDDDVTRGRRQVSPLGVPYSSVEQPNHVETVIATLPWNDGSEALWKWSRYFDNPQFWSEPGVQDVTVQPVNGGACGPFPGGVASVKTEPAQEEYELYNVSDDPLEIRNLADSPAFADVRLQMMRLLEEQRMRKRFYPGQV